MKWISQKQKLNEVYAEDLLIEIDNKTRKKIQTSLLEMFLEIQDVCFRNGIDIYLCGGSALGAVRHKGFIPWDDDIDVSMTREDYNRFCSVFRKELSDRYVLNAPNICKKPKSRFPKIMKKGTVFREIGDTSDEENCGLFIDIFILENVPDKKLHRLIKGALCNVCEFIGGQVALTEAGLQWRTLNKRAGKLNYYIRYFCGKVFSFDSASKWYCRIDRIIQYDNNKTMDCSLATGIKHYFGEVIKREDCMPPRQVIFEGNKAYVFHNIEEYLSNLYGSDYMIPPPPGKRQNHLIEELRL